MSSSQPIEPKSIDLQRSSELIGPPSYNPMSEPLPSQADPSQVPPSQAALPLPSQAPPSTNHPLSDAERGERYRQERPYFGPFPSRHVDTNIFLVFAQCADGNHDPIRRYGLCGIITAIVSTCNYSLC